MRCIIANTHEEVLCYSLPMAVHGFITLFQVQVQGLAQALALFWTCIFSQPYLAVLCQCLILFLFKEYSGRI